MVFAHCDTMDGPVIQAAQKALEIGNVDLVLIWGQKEDEDEIRNAFRQALSVRKLSPEAKQLADMYFFETLVRIHRAGEGASYTGLKLAGSELNPAVEAADQAVTEGSVKALADEIGEKASSRVVALFKEVMEKKKHKDESVEAGREFVKAYVTFVHYVEEHHGIIYKKVLHGETEQKSHAH